MRNENETRIETEDEARRKPYAAPRVAIYGDLRSVTLTSFTKNKNDPGNSSSTMT